jgi:hypothetical protein
MAEGLGREDGGSQELITTKRTHRLKWFYELLTHLERHCGRARKHLINAKANASFEYEKMPSSFVRMSHA